MSSQKEFTVTDELYEISEATNSDGSVDVEVFDFEKSADGESVKVWFHTPTMEKKSETMDWPRNDSNTYKFVRLCRKAVGGLNGAEWLKQDGAKIRADPDNWELRASLTRGERIKQQASNLTLGKVGVGLFLTAAGAWMLALGVILVGIPIVFLASLLGITTLFVGAGPLWGVSLSLFFLSCLILGALDS